MRVGLLFLPVLYLLPGSILPLRSQDSDVGSKSQAGKQLMAEGRYAEAVPVYRQLVEALPGNSGLLLNLGMAIHLSGQDREAIPQFAAASRLQPDLFPAALFLGAANLRLGRNAEAVAPLQKAVRLQPDSRDASSMLAEALVGLERYAEAEPHLRRLTVMAPADPAAWFNLAKAYEALAGSSFDRLLKQDPESPLGLALVAEARLKQDRRAAAFHLYRQAIERGPRLRGLHAAVAGIYRSEGHPDWAAVEEEKERRLPAPDCSREPLECAFSSGQDHQVVAIASKLRSPEARYWLVRAYNELAVQAFSRLAALPPSAESHEWMAQMYRNERRYGESAQELRKAVDLTPGNLRLRMELAEMLWLNRDFAGAQQVLEELLRARPDEPGPNHLLGEVLLAQQQPERAIPPLEKAVRLEPGRAEVHGALGRAYALVDRAADAVPHLKQAISADTDGSLRYQLARCYQAIGETEKAELALKDYEEFRKAAEPGPEATARGAITPP